VTSRTLNLKRKTVARKISEQVRAMQDGHHQRHVNTRDMPGAGTKSRLMSSKSGAREIHLLSDAEKSQFLKVWRDKTSKLIYDQVALNTDESALAAIQVGVRHPATGRDHEPLTLSTDLVAIHEVNGRVRRRAISVKTLGAGPKELTPKQMIEKKYWENRASEFEAVWANGMHSPVSKNLEWLLRTENEMHGRDLSASELIARRELVRRLIRRRDNLVIDACRAVETEFQLRSGSGVRAFRQLALERQLSFDMNATSPVFLPVASIRMHVLRTTVPSRASTR
jgi:hypothetical protein